MDKNRLQIGKAYLQKRSTEIDSIQRTAERWLKCKEVTENGAVFKRLFEPDIVLTNKQIKEEIFEDKEK